MADIHERRMRFLLWVMIAAMLLVFGVNQCRGQFVKFTPQPRPSGHVRVYSALFCSARDSIEPMAVNLATITKYAPPELPILNPYARSYEQRVQPDHILVKAGDTVFDVANGFLVGLATGAIEYSGVKLPRAAAGYAFLWERIRTPVEQALNKALSQQEFWGDLLVQIPAGGGCQMAAVAVLRSADKADRKRIESRAIEVQIPVNPPLSRLSHPARFDVIDWDRQAADAMRENGPAACVIRPSSVETEGCGAWYG